jgi:quinol monooxygenase YgiN
MTEIQLTAHITIHPGKLDRFKAAAANCLKIVREKDKGTYQYDW